MPEEKEKSSWKLYLGILLFVLVAFCLYAITLITLTGPINEYSIKTSGPFGDSFGPLTALFSGLAFAGMIITIHLQYTELKLQRVERKEQNAQFTRTAQAQEETARLSALSALLEEYKYALSKNSESLDLSGYVNDGASLAIRRENKEIYRKRKIIITQLEEHLGLEHENQT